jgi:RimJ/RimL family protein N-acetyltransferase
VPSVSTLVRRGSAPTVRPESAASGTALSGEGVVLRPVRASDAPALWRHIMRPQVIEHIAEPPTTVEEFRGFVRWTQRHSRRHRCFGIVPAGLNEPVGVIQLWSVASCFQTAEWGFALDDTWWGTGLFPAAGVLAVEYAFRSLGVQRLEARASVENGRGNGALAKLGAVREGVLRSNATRHGRFVDHAMWSLLADEWPRTLGAFRARAHAAGQTGSEDGRPSRPDVPRPASDSTFTSEDIATTSTRMTNGLLISAPWTPPDVSGLAWGRPNNRPDDR